MTKLDILTAKLRLLGDDVVILSDEAIISKPQSKDYVICYNLSSDKILHKRYDTIIPEEIEEDTKFIIGISLDPYETHLLDRNLIIKSKFYNETVRSIIYNRFVLVDRVSGNNYNNTYRLTTIEGKTLTDGVVKRILIWDIGNNLILARCSLANGQDYLIRTINDNKGIKLIEGFKTVDEVYVGKGLIAIKDDCNTLRLYKHTNLGVKLLLVIKNCLVVKNKDTYKLCDSYRNTIKSFPASKVIR